MHGLGQRLWKKILRLSAASGIHGVQRTIPNAHVPVEIAVHISGC